MTRTRYPLIPFDDDDDDRQLHASDLRIAKHTSGRFFRVRRAVDLEAVYAEIDALERTARPAPGRPLERSRPEPWLALAGLLLAAEIGVTRIGARTLP